MWKLFNKGKEVQTDKESVLIYSQKNKAYTLDWPYEEKAVFIGDHEDYCNCLMKNFEPINKKYNLNYDFYALKLNYELQVTGQPIIAYSRMQSEKNLMPYGIYSLVQIDFSETGFRPLTINADDFVDFHNEELKLFQKKLKDFFKNRKKYEKLKIRHKGATLLFGPPGCHAKDTEILMFDGSIKKVQDVAVGDLLMGPDSKSREVLKLVQGRDKMVKIKPTKGEEFIINHNHMLHLTPSGEHTVRCPINISFKDYEQQTGPFQERFKLTRTGVEFTEKEQQIPAYILGLWLGDGHTWKPALTTMDDEIENEWVNYIHQFPKVFPKIYQKGRCKTIHASIGKKITGKRRNSVLNIFNDMKLIGNKHIPINYKLGSRKQRLELLAGLIDTDGHYNKFGSFDYITKLEHLAKDVVFIARSLGFAAYLSPCRKQCVNNGVWGTYYRINISGDNNEIPTRLKRKNAPIRKQIKSVLRTGFKYESLPEDDFYGFTLSDDHLYLTTDFTIHHNCGKSVNIINSVKSLSKKAYCIFVNKSLSLSALNEYKQVFAGHDVIIILEEITERLGHGTEDLLNFLDGYASWDNCYVIATTNHPEFLPSNLANRPGRFNNLLEIKLPTDEQKTIFLSQKGFSPEEIKAVLPKTKDFSIDEISQLAIHSKLEELPLDVYLKVLDENKKKAKNAFKGKSSMGIG